MIVEYNKQKMQIRHEPSFLLQLFEKEQRAYFELAKDFVVPVSTKSTAMCIKDAKALKEQYSNTGKSITRKNDLAKGKINYQKRKTKIK